jgi:hypothetical protein
MSKTYDASITKIIRISEEQTFVKCKPIWVSKGGLSILGAMFLQQVTWRAIRHGEFYKFNGPCDHKLYNPGDSWEEELAMTSHEFNTARKQVAVKVKGSDKPGESGALVEYWTRQERTTHYRVNWTVFEKFLLSLYEDESLNTESAVRAESLNTESAVTVNTESVVCKTGKAESVYIQKTTAKTTAKTENNKTKKQVIFSFVEKADCVMKQGRFVFPQLDDWTDRLYEENKQYFEGPGSWDDNPIEQVKGVGRSNKNTILHRVSGNATDKEALRLVVQNFVAQAGKEKLQYKYLSTRYGKADRKAIFVADCMRTVFRLITDKDIGMKKSALLPEPDKTLASLQPILETRGIFFDEVASSFLRDIAEQIEAGNNFWAGKKSVPLTSVFERAQELLDAKS